MRLTLLPSPCICVTICGKITYVQNRRVKFSLMNSIQIGKDVIPLIKHIDAGSIYSLISQEPGGIRISRVIRRGSCTVVQGKLWVLADTESNGLVLYSANSSEGALDAGLTISCTLQNLALSCQYPEFNDNEVLMGAICTWNNLLTVVYSDKKGILHSFQSKKSVARSPDCSSKQVRIPLPAKGILHDISSSGTYIVASGTFKNGIWAARVQEPEQVCTLSINGTSSPSVAADIRGHMHLCYQQDLPTDRSKGKISDYHSEKINRRIMYAKIGMNCQGEFPGHPELAAWAISSSPSLVIVNENPLIVFQADGSKCPKVDEDFVYEREGAGSSIGYAFRETNSDAECLSDSNRLEQKNHWQRRTLSASREIIIRSSGASPTSYRQGTLRPFYEWHEGPVIILDAQNIPNVFWYEKTSNLLCRSRWLGYGFSTPATVRSFITPGFEFISACMNPNNSFTALIGKEIPGKSSMLTHMGLELEFTSVISNLKASSKFLPLTDLEEFSEVQGLEKHIKPMEKYRENPIFTPGKKSSWDSDMVSMPFVLYVPERHIFAMFYTGGSYRTGRGWRCGYAESKDGTVWKRTSLVIDGVSTDNGPLPFLHPFRDKQEHDEAKRYKSFFCSREGGKVLGIAWSADCLNWHTNRESAETINSTLNFTEIPVLSYRDDFGRYHITGRTFSYSGRSLGLQFSEDLVHWSNSVRFPEKPTVSTGENLVTYGANILDASGAKPFEHQIYYGYSGEKIHGVRYLFYAPCRPDGRYDTALAFSRDDRHFERLVPGENLLSCGELGEWDNGFIAGFTPVITGSRLRFYYGSSGWHHNTDKGCAFPLHRPNWQIGYAETDKDRLVYLCLKRFTGIGHLLTKEIAPAEGAVRIFLIFDGPRDGITMEVLVNRDDGSSRESAEAHEKYVDALHPFKLRITIVSSDVRFYGLQFEEVSK